MRVARESWPLVAALALLAAAVGFLLHPLAALPVLAAAGFTLWFFRDPERETPREPDALVSPADGRVITAGPRAISIFMNVFDVHVCRAPTGGRVESLKHEPGRFLAAFRDEASEQNERVSILLTDGPRQVRCTLVAGLIARRIVCKVAAGQRLEAGERVGLIQFGSRVDVALPEGSRILAGTGQKVLAGETVLARLPPL